MPFNPDDYRSDIASLKLTAEQEDELLKTLYEIMFGFAELGWGVSALDQVLPDIFARAGHSQEYSPNDTPLILDQTQTIKDTQ